MTLPLAHRKEHLSRVDDSEFLTFVEQRMDRWRRPAYLMQSDRHTAEVRLPWLRGAGFGAVPGIELDGRTGRLSVEILSFEPCSDP